MRKIATKQDIQEMLKHPKKILDHIGLSGFRDVRLGIPVQSDGPVLHVSVPKGKKYEIPAEFIFSIPEKDLELVVKVQVKEDYKPSYALNMERIKEIMAVVEHLPRLPEGSTSIHDGHGFCAVGAIMEAYRQAHTRECYWELIDCNEDEFVTKSYHLLGAGVETVRDWAGMTTSQWCNTADLHDDWGDTAYMPLSRIIEMGLKSTGE